MVAQNKRIHVEKCPIKHFCVFSSIYPEFPALFIKEPHLRFSSKYITYLSLLKRPFPFQEELKMDPKTKTTKYEFLKMHFKKLSTQLVH